MCTYYVQDKLPKVLIRTYFSEIGCILARNYEIMGISQLSAIHYDTFYCKLHPPSYTCKENLKKPFNFLLQIAYFEYLMK